MAQMCDVATEVVEVVLVEPQPPKHSGEALQLTQP